MAKHDRRLAVLASVAEARFRVDPLATLMRLRQLSEALASEAAARTGIYLGEREDQVDRLRRLSDARVMSRELADVFHALRKLGNRAAHHGEGDASAALLALKLAREVSVWFHRSFGGEPGWKPGPFIPPVACRRSTTRLKVIDRRLLAHVVDRRHPVRAMKARTPKEVGLLIRERRRALQLDQRELARRTGVSRQWVIDLEGGKPGVALGLVLRAAQSLGLAFDLSTVATETGSREASDLDALVEQHTRPPARKVRRG